MRLLASLRISEEEGMSSQRDSLQLLSSATLMDVLKLLQHVCLMTLGYDLPKRNRFHIFT